jgi:hypothetical protein
MLVIKYGYMFWISLSHPQANMVTEFRYTTAKKSPGYVWNRWQLEMDSYTK